MVETQNLIATRFFRLAAAFGIAVVALGLGASKAFAFSVAFSWCTGSPAFQLNDVPRGTTTLQFAMRDLDKPAFNHGGGTVGYRGQTEVPCDAFASGFIGPAPPPGEVHTYEFTVKAFATDGALLAATTARRKFPER